MFSLEWLRTRSAEVRQVLSFQGKKEDASAKEIRDKVFALTTEEVVQGWASGPFMEDTLRVVDLVLT